MLNQPWYYFATSIGIILIVNLAAYLIFRQHYKTPRLLWVSRTHIVHPAHIAQPGGTAASVEVKTEKILTVSRVVFWNSGLKAIILSGAPSNNPLRLKAGENGKILSVRLLNQNNPYDPIRIELTGDSSVAIKFVSLSYHGGGIIEVVHRGGPVVMTGELIEAVVEQGSSKSDDLDDIPFSVLWFWAKQPLRRILKTIFYSVCMLFLGLALPGAWLNLNSGAGMGLIAWPWARALFLILMVLWCTWQVWKTPKLPTRLFAFYDGMK